MNIYETLKKLTSANGVSGNEKSVSEVALSLLKQYAPEAKIDAQGSVTAFIGDANDKKPIILLDAHIDEIGLIVTFIDERGFITAEACGGIDRRLLPAQSVVINGKKPVKGLITSTPPHVNKDEDASLKADAIRIDTGLSKKELLEVISLGDRVIIEGELVQLLSDKISGKALDDRAGVTAVLYALSLLSEVSADNKGFNIAVAFSVQEEIGLRGAKTASYNSEADYAIAVDVSYGVSPSISSAERHKCGELGKGPMLGYAPSLNREMFEELKKTAEAQNINYQLEILNRDTGGTNADEISISKGGIKTALISIPLRYMHSPVETISLSDIEATGKLIAEYIKGFKSSNIYH